MRSRKWMSIRGLGFALAVMMLLSCVVMVPDESRVSTHAAVSELALGVSAVPTAPLNPVADAGNRFVWLWWDHPSDQGSDLIKNYTIYRNATGSSTNFVKLATVQIGPFSPVGTNIAFNDSTVLNGITYFYKIAADSDAGEGANSTIVSVNPVASATAPGAVQNLVAVNGNYSAQLNWTSPATAGSTPIRYIDVTVPGIFGSNTVRLPANAVGYRVTDVDPGQSYNYTVRAISSTHGTANATIQKFIGGTGNVPSSPRNMTATGSDRNVTLTWDNPANPSSHGIENYTVLRSDAQTGPFVFIGSSTNFFGLLQTSFGDENVTNGHKYYYEVVANNAFGPSAPSNIANATPTYIPDTPVATAYPGNGQVLLVWSAPFNTTSVSIYRSTSAGALGTLMNSSTQSILTRFFWYDNGTTNGVKYYYTVRANLTNVLLNSNQTNATPFAGSVPAAPTGLIATPDTDGVGLYAKLATSQDVIIGYSIYRGNTAGTEGAVPIKNVSLISVLSSSLLTSSLSGSLIASDTTPLDDVNHYYYVTVQNLFGNSPHSNEAVSFASLTGDAPVPVSDLSATGGSGQVTLTWSNPTYQGTANLLTYFIGRTNGTTQTFVGFVTAGLGQQTFVDLTAQPGVTYQYRVLVSNNYGSASAPSNVAQATTSSNNVVPSAPLNLVAQVGIGYVKLTWSAPTTAGPGILNYTIFRGTASGQEGTTVFKSVSGTTLTFNDTPVTSGQSYYYKVKAVNSVGSSPESNEAAAPAPSAPTAPLNLTAFASAGQIRLNWSVPTSVGTGLTQYRVYRSTTPGGEGTDSIITVSSTNLTAIDVNVLAGTVYYYEVKAVNVAGVGPGSNEVSATAVTVPGVPSAPLGLTAVAGNSYIVLNWTAPTTVGTGIVHYMVYRGLTASGESSEAIAEVAPTLRTYNDTTVTVEIPYYYVVKAMNANGTGNPSNEVTAAAHNPALPSSPRNVVATPEAGQIVLTWSAPNSNGTSPITGYNIYRSDNGSVATLLKSVGPTALSYTDKSVVAGHTYGYSVVAQNANGNGTVSITATAIPNAPSSGGSDNTALFAGIAIVVIAIIAAIGYVVLRKKK
jgi:fibronectin type 3 domain-containing protein